MGKTNYQIGKAFHIYKPELIDGDGNSSWGILDYNEGVLTVTIPLAVYDNPNTNWNSFIRLKPCFLDCIYDVLLHSIS